MSFKEEIWSDGWQCGSIKERVIACSRQRESRSPARKISREQGTESANSRKRGGIAKKTIDGEDSDSFQRHTVDIPGLFRVNADNLSRLDKLWDVNLHSIFQRRGLQGIVLSPTDPRSC